MRRDLEDLLNSGALSMADLVESVRTQQIELSTLRRENALLRRACREETVKARGPDLWTHAVFSRASSLFCFPALLPAAPSPRLVFSPEEWKFGMIIQGATIRAMSL